VPLDLTSVVQRLVGNRMVRTYFRIVYTNVAREYPASCIRLTRTAFGFRGAVITSRVRFENVEVCVCSPTAYGIEARIGVARHGIPGHVLLLNFNNHHCSSLLSRTKSKPVFFPVDLQSFYINFVTSALLC